MIIEKNRHLVILYQLISESKPVSSEKLAQLTLVTSKTIKYDISTMNAKLKEEDIAEIISYKSKGYEIVPLNEQKYNEFKSSLIEMHILFEDTNIEAMNRRLYILQRLFTDEFVKTDDLAEELYISKSSISNDLAWINQFLKSYYISTKSERGRGLTIEGAEQDIRSAMVEVYVSLYQHYKFISSNNHFRELFYTEDSEYDSIRRTVLKILRQSRIQITELNSSKLVAYVCLAKKRSQSGKSPYLSEKIIKELKETYEYVLAQEITNNEHLKLFDIDNEVEIVNLSRLLIIYRDIDLQDKKCLATIPQYLLEKNHNLFNTIISEVVDETGNVLFYTEAFKRYALELESLQMKMFLEHYFDHTSKKHLFWFAEGDEYSASPLSLEFVRMIILKLQNHFGELICSDTIMSFVMVFKSILYQIEFSYNKQKLIVTSMEGLITSRIIKEFIEKRYSSYVSQVEFYNLYEMRKLDFTQYDAVIHSGIATYFNYPIKCVSYRELNFLRDGDEQLFEKLFFDGYSRDQVDKLSEILHIVKNENVIDINRYLELLSYKYCKEKSVQPKILTNILEKDRIIKYLYAKSGICLVMFDYNDTGTEIFDIYKLSQNIYYNNILKIKYVIAVCISTQISISDAKMVDSILQCLVNHKSYIDQLVSGKLQLEDIFKETARNDFLFSI